MTPDQSLQPQSVVEVHPRDEEFEGDTRSHCPRFMRYAAERHSLVGGPGRLSALCVLQYSVVVSTPEITCRKLFCEYAVEPSSEGYTQPSVKTRKGVLKLSKCDGERPVCGPCTRVPKDDPCEYTDTMSRTQELQETVFRLQSRIDELQGGPGPSNYSGHLSARASPFSASSAGSPGSSENSFLEFQEPPLAMIDMLLQYFIPHATQFGFFLHAGRFRDAALLPLPFGDVRRPSPALLCVVYLWGAHLSQAQPLLASEPLFLRRAQQHIATDISGTPHSQILHTIQAQILLAAYLFRIKRLLEAEVQANGAATLALRHGLHRIRSARPSSSSLSLSLPPPADAVEEGERIRGFWAVATLQSYLCITLNGTAAAFCVLEGPVADIDTPWPLELDDYAAGALPLDYRGQESIRQFMTEDLLPSSPVSVLYTKAAVLLYRAARLTAGWAPLLPPDQAAAYISAYTHLDRRITQFWQTLPPVYAAYDDPAAARTHVLVHALTAGAALRLHSSPAGSDGAAQDKCVFAARAVLDVLGDTRVRHRATAHPVLGSIGAAACTTLMEEVSRERTSRANWDSSGWGRGAAASIPSTGSQEISLLAHLRTGMAAMQVYAAESPLIEYQLLKLRQRFETL